MDKQNRFLELLNKYTSGSLDMDEQEEFFSYVRSGEYEELLSRHIEGNLEQEQLPGAGLQPETSQQIMHHILSSERHTHLLIPRKNTRVRILRWSVAAAITGLIAVTVYIMNRPSTPGITMTGTQKAAGLEERVNTSNQPMKLQLEDGSIVTLQPESKISFPTHFATDKREVYLDGEAFFEVSKNPKHPFFVYNNNIVTHVLGTSFNVKMDKEKKEVEVSVRTGRVEVYENNVAEKTTNKKTDNGVVLMPNQKVVYHESNRQFVPSLVEVPLPIIVETEKTDLVKENFVFEEEKMTNVLAMLEKAYGIEIVVENDNIYHCLFTGDVAMQNLYTKLDIICQSIKASYEIKGTKILIKGKGCD
jgi:ferric-dicitrate binding protein FerR (iron transport regulator)